MKNVFAVLWAVLSSSLPAFATVNTFYYWHMGESDPGATNSALCSHTIDSVVGLALTNTPSVQGPPYYPIYSTNVSPIAQTNSGSDLSIQYVGGQYGSAAPIRELTDNFGVELWVEPFSNTNTACLVYNGNSSSSGWGLYQFNDGTFRAIFGGLSIFGYAPALTNVWTHLALVVTNGVGTFYANGVASGFYNAAFNPVEPSDLLRLAANILGGEDYNGLMDELRVFTFAPNQFSPSDLLYFNGATNLVSGTPVVYDTYGPNFSYSTFDESAGCSTGYWQAMPFSPVVNATLDHILVPVYFWPGSTGPNQMRFTLTSDVYTNSQHQPGATIETWLLSNLSTPSEGHQYYPETMVPTQPIKLTSGVQYWLVGSSDNPSSTSYWGINTANPNLLRTAAVSEDQGTNWISPDGEINASFQVYGNVIPVITGISATNSSVTILATNGIAGYDYVTLVGTNLSEPLNAWTPLNANLLVNYGSFTNSLPNVLNGRPQFYRLRIQ